MSHSDLANYFKTQFYMTKNDYSHVEVEEMMVFERDIYVSMILEEKSK